MTDELVAVISLCGRLRVGVHPVEKREELRDHPLRTVVLPVGVTDS